MVRLHLNVKQLAEEVNVPPQKTNEILAKRHRLE